MNRIKSIMRRYISILLFLLICCAVFPQSSGAEKDLVPVPYGPGEFPDWQKDLRRSEIIALGALPFVTFMASIGYDVFRFIDNDYQDEYLPWPLKKQDIAAPLSETEQKNILFMSAGVSVGFAVIDFALHTIKRSQAKKKAMHSSENRNSIRVTPIQNETPEIITSEQN